MLAKKMNMFKAAVVALVSVFVIAGASPGECAIGYPGRTQTQSAANAEQSEIVTIVEGEDVTGRDTMEQQVEMPMYLVFQKVDGKYLPLDPSKPVNAVHRDKFVVITPDLKTLEKLESNLISAKQKYKEFKMEKDVPHEALEFACKFYGVNPEQLGGFELTFKDPNHKPSWFESFFKNIANSVLGTFTGGLLHL